MSVPKQKPKPNNISGTLQRRVEYFPPDPKVIDEFARTVCTEFTRQGDVACSDPEVVNGFAGFLNFVADVLAQQLTKKANVEEGV